MGCPDCRAELGKLNDRGIEIKECPRCKGRWFSRDELKKAKARTDEDLRWLDFDPFGDDAPTATSETGRRHCPQCGQKMAVLSYAASKVVIDKCSRCRGVWLDHKEFGQIVAYLERLLLAKDTGELVKDAFRHFFRIAAQPDHAAAEVKDFLAVLKLLQMRIAAEHPAITKASERIYQAWPFK
ncbi:MAG TPA: zf-TFIIB domain-containing protein [bacterium]